MKVKTYRNGLLTMFMLNFRHSLAGYKLLKAVGLRHGRFERSLIKESVSLVYFLSPNPLALDLVDAPMITTVWDLGHRDIPEFVEISGDRHYEEREFFYRQTIPKSFRVIVDTDRTAERIQAIYGALENRIIVQGLGVVQPAVPERINSAGSRFFLYPAQFWPHKRHVLLLKAFHIVCEQDKNCRLVLTGTDKGNLDYVREVANKLGVLERIEFRGFVSSSELAELMMDAHFLVFPSQLGPSNMPPLEAASLGTPVLISNIHFDPLLKHPLIHTVSSQEPNVWAKEMLRLLSLPKSANSPLAVTNEDSHTTLIGALDDFAAIRAEWTSSIMDRFKRK
jgi:glycosyltransferase involved in cell wall biosynthesis